MSPLLVWSAQATEPQRQDRVDVVISDDSEQAS
jgi:hypothetical protein